MTKIQIELPESTAKAAKEAGLLTPDALNRLFTDAIRRLRAAGATTVEEVVDRVLSWPPEAQEEAVASLATIEEQFVALQTVSSEGQDALARSAEDMRLGRYATEEQVKAVFDRYRRA